jgi:hypothetical protein
MTWDSSSSCTPGRRSAFGPLAYNGVLAFWVVAVDFFVWMSVVMMKVIGRDEQRLRSLTI